MEIVNGVVVPLPDLTKETDSVEKFEKEPSSRKRKASVRKNLFPLDTDVTPKKPNEKSIELIFLSDSQNGKESPTAQKSLQRTCKNGVKPGFYRNGGSPKGTSEASSTSRLSSPKASQR